MPIIQKITTAKIAVAIALLLAFADWPYAYYQLLRWAVCGISGYSAYKAHEEKMFVWAWIFGGIAILFNPIAPIHFARETWQFLDVASALVFFVSFFFLLPDKIIK